jgi:hypothetical protein
MYAGDARQHLLVKHTHVAARFRVACANLDTQGFCQAVHLVPHGRKFTARLAVQLQKPLFQLVSLQRS